MIHPLADVQSKTIGEGTQVWQFTVVLPGAVVGKNCNLNAQVFVENDVVIGDNVTVKCGVQIWDGISLEDGVFIGPNATFTNDLLPRSKRYPGDFLRTTVKAGASVGANATIVGGRTIGERAMIGAGSVLTKNVGPHELWYGSPACRRGFVCECAHRLNIAMSCSRCGAVYCINSSEKVERIG